MILGVLAAPSMASRVQEKPTTINVPPEEAKAYEPIAKATTPDEVIAAAKDFIAKYPKSAALPQVEIAVFNKIVDSPKDEKRVANTETFKQMFPTSERGLELERGLVDYYIQKGDLASIKRVSEAYLAKHPDDVVTHYLMLRIAVDALKRQDASLLSAGKEHGKRAIEMLEATTRPATFPTDADWQKYKAENLELAYQSYGIIGLASGDMTMAVDYLTKATTAGPADPLNYLFLASIKEGEYQELAQKFNALPDKKSPDAQKAMDAANAKIDEVIPLLAKAVVLSEAKPEYAAINQQARPALEDRYKQRHNGKLDGLDAVLKAAREGK